MAHIEYTRRGDWLAFDQRIETGTVFSFQAKGVRRERTGVHATVAILANENPIAWTNFNIERDEDRGRLANSAFSHVGEMDGAIAPKQYLKSLLDAFCYGLWPAALNGQIGELTAGDPTIGPPRRILGAYVIDSGGTIIFAPPGRGKSYIGLTMALSLDAGIGAVWSSERRRALYVNLERSRQSMAYRLSRVASCLGLSDTYELPMFHHRGGSLADLEDSVQATAEKYACTVAIVDSLSRAGAGDLKEDRVANSVMDTMNRAFPTWILLAHTPRADESHTFGSVMFDAAADVTVKVSSQLSQDALTLGVGLQVEKANDVPRGPKTLSIVAFDFAEDLGLSGIRRSGRAEFPEIQEAQPSVADEIAEHLGQVGEASASDLAEITGRNRQHVVEILRSNRRFVFTRKDGKQVFYGLRYE